MALKKSQIYSSLWQSCDELRGGMDASQYKDYILTLLFMKYVSDKYAGKPDTLIEVPTGGGFADMAKLKGDKEIGDRINKIIGRLAEANDLKGVIDQADFNDEAKLGKGKEMQDRLSKLVAIFDGLDFRANRADGDDLLGDAYEYLMRHFASESGKSKDQFYTPAEVSRIMAQVIGISSDTRQDQTIYDPTCGSGSLLLKAADQAPRGITIYGTGIPACILVIDKENAHARTGVFMIDASKGFLKDGAKNRLRAQDIHKIVDIFNQQTELPRYSRMVPVAEIASPKNDYNLNIPRYIDSSEPEDLHDLDAHLKGGIPDRDIDALEAYWTVFPSLRQTLFAESGRAGYCDALVEKPQVRAAILGHSEFKSYQQQSAAVFDKWRKAHEALLNRLATKGKPRNIIETLSEDLLARFSGMPLLDSYDIYQRLMGYWDETMQDDIYLVTAEGWIEAARPRSLISDKGKKNKEKPDLTIGRKKYKMDLVPPALIVARYFASEHDAIEALRARQEAAGRELEEFVEEHTGEDGLLEDAANDQGKVTRVSVKARLRSVRNEPDAEEERTALTRCLALLEAESRAGKGVKEAQNVLDEQVLARYATLTETEIKTLVVEDQWLKNIRAAIEGEVQRLTQQLARRVKELEERYARPLPELEREVEAFGDKVAGHLKRMGVSL